MEVQKSKHNLFIINGHGCSIPSNYIDDNSSIIPESITLKKNQYIILNKEMNDLRGSFWLQEELWGKIATSKDSLQFIKNIIQTKNKGELKDDLFGYYGSNIDEKTTCPNLFINLSLSGTDYYIDR